MSRILKRLAVGRPISSHEEAHHRLSKKIALAVFSSDALSSSAYATDEILLALSLAGAAAIGLAAPISGVVAVVLIIVIISYRQTVKAYPGGGGAFIVAHENLGRFPGLIAASALLIDYVLTVTVSTAAGLAAVGAAFEQVRPYRVWLGVGIVTFITALNLRGLKESGTIFAIPTYGFLISMGGMILYGLVKVATGDYVPYPPSHAPAEQALTLFLILRAFSSGSTALTGIEAISDGVPAFRKPESKNAAQTLAVLGGLLAFLFIGLTILARAFHVDPHLIEEGKTVSSQIAAGLFGAATPLFYVIQAFTALILFLAANTSFADFPRLASILARERYLPRALQNRGDRLAFSNGIVILAVAASGLLINYRADLHKIIPLYVIGVFTGFTLSQSGMVIRWRKEARKAKRLGKPPPRGWKRSAAVNAVGASTTFIVFVIVAVTKFELGAWQILLLIPLLALLLQKIKAHYMHVAEQLRVDRSVHEMRSGKVVLVVMRADGATKALAFARSISTKNDLRIVTLRGAGSDVETLRNRWDQMGVKNRIEQIGSRVQHLVEFVKSLDPGPDELVTVILPDPQFKSWFQQLINNRFALRVKRAFLYESETALVSIPFRPEVEIEPTRLQAPGRLALIVFVGAVHKATVRALQYARSLHPSELKAMNIQTYAGEAAALTQEWSNWGIDVPLEIVDSPYRSLMQPLLKEVRDLHPNPSDAIGVVVPEFVVKHWWQTLLHNQTAFLIKSALLFEPNVMVINVPYRLTPSSRKAKPLRAAAEAG